MSLDTATDGWTYPRERQMTKREIERIYKMLNSVDEGIQNLGLVYMGTICPVYSSAPRRAMMSFYKGHLARHAYELGLLHGKTFLYGDSVDRESMRPAEEQGSRDEASRHAHISPDEGV